MGRIIKGRVFDVETQQPLRFAVVAGTDAQGNVVTPPEHATTESDGSFRIDINNSTHLGAKYTGYPRMVLPIIGNTDFDFPMKSGIELERITVEGKEKKEGAVPNWLIWVGAGVLVLGIGIVVYKSTREN